MRNLIDVLLAAGLGAAALFNPILPKAAAQWRDNSVDSARAKWVASWDSTWADSLQKLPLRWTDRSLNQLYFLAQAADHELIACGYGHVLSDTVVVELIVTTPLIVSDTDRAVPREACLEGALVEWHNHPWTGPMTDAGIEKPAELCRMSFGDISAAQGSHLPFSSISVGRGDPRYSWLCWWPRSQFSRTMRWSQPGQRKKYWSE